MDHEFHRRKSPLCLLPICQATPPVLSSDPPPVLGRQAKKDFFTRLESVRRHGDVEAKVEVAINDLLETYFTKAYSKSSVKATKAHQTDGVIEVKSLMDSFSILVEAKRGYELGGANPRDRAKILAQAIGYLKRFEHRGDTLPTAVVLADEDEIFTLPSRLLTPYLVGPYDWSKAPSSQWEDAKLFLALTEDPNLNSIYVERTDNKGFDPDHFCHRVKAYARDDTELEKLRVDKHSLEKAFAEFQRVVFGGVTPGEKTKKVELFGKKKSVTYAQVQIFIKALLGDKNIYLDPVDRKTVVIVYKDAKGDERLFRYPPATGFTFNPEAYEQFFTKYDRGRAIYDTAARREITEIADTLFDEFDRRFTGDYWTPQIWVDEAHRMIEEQLGSDWKEKYVVWDPACGSKNLTRGYQFKELYCSTLHQEELNIAEDYNQDATTFQYDFLNDDMDLHGLQFDNRNAAHFKIPDQLIGALKSNKPIVFFANPPYGQSGSAMGKEHKDSLASTAINSLMVREKFSLAAVELYTQFIYRVQLLAKTFNYTQDFHIYFFTKPFFSIQSFSVFSRNLLSQFQHRGGFLLNSGEFKGTSSAWGISFTSLSLEKEVETIQQLNYSVLQTTKSIIPTIEKIGEWSPTLPPKQNIEHWQGNNSSEKKLTSFPVTKSGFDAPPNPPRGFAVEGSFGHGCRPGANVQKSDKYLGLYSLCFSHGGTSITAESFTRTLIAFAVRKSHYQILSNQDLLWVRDKDAFSVPSAKLQEDTTFTADCVTYSLFASGANQTSLRGYEYEGKTWDVKNEFFWTPSLWVRDWAVVEQAWDVRDDVDLFSGERYVSSWLTEHYEDLLDDAKALLKTARSIVKASMKYRKAYNDLHPKYNLLTWDTGWLQIYKMCYSRDALPAAKQDIYLQRLYETFKLQRRTLGDSIAERYSEDTGF